MRLPFSNELIIGELRQSPQEVEVTCSVPLRGEATIPTSIVSLELGDVSALELVNTEYKSEVVHWRYVQCGRLSQYLLALAFQIQLLFSCNSGRAVMKEGQLRPCIRALKT